MAHSDSSTRRNGGHRLRRLISQYRLASPLFEDRRDAGEQLGRELLRRGLDGLLLGLPRGGVVVAAAASEVMESKLGVYVVRKLRAPSNDELAIGAVAEDGPPVLDVETLDALRISAEYVDREVANRREQIARFRSTRLLPSNPVIFGADVLVIDDGIATGATVEAAVRGLGSRSPKSVTVAAPVASKQAMDRLRPLCDDIIVLESPSRFFAVGQYYRQFEQTRDDEVVAALTESRRR